MSALYSALGSVCESCEVYNDPGLLDCAACGASLGGARWVNELATTPPPAPSDGGAPSLTFMGKAPIIDGQISAGPPEIQRTPGPFVGAAGTPGPAPHPSRQVARAGGPAPAGFTPGPHATPAAGPPSAGSPAPRPTSPAAGTPGSRGSSAEGPVAAPLGFTPGPTTLAAGAPGPMPAGASAPATFSPGPAASAASGDGPSSLGPSGQAAPLPASSPGPAGPRPVPTPPADPLRGATILGTPGPLFAVAEDSNECPRCGRPYLAQTRFCANCGLKLSGGPAPRAPAARIGQGAVKLMLLRGMGASGTSFHLADEITQLGRSTGQIRFPSDDTLGSLAASFVYRGGRLFVRDEGGPSGVFVRLQAPSVLLPNDWFSIGDKLLRFLGRVPLPHPEPNLPRQLGSMRPGNGPLLRIQLVHLGGIGGRVFARPAPVRIGRALGEILFGDDPFISTRHCELDLDPAGAVLRDLGSSNGTFVRLPPGTEREIGPGDTLRLGRNILRVDP